MRLHFIKEKAKSIPFVYKTYQVLLSLRPQSIYFERNLKKVKKFDRHYGTDFSGRLYWDEIGTSRERANDYSPSPDKLVKALDKMRIKGDDAILDMGCGKGFAMYIMSKYPFGKIGGVELSEKLCYVANMNLGRVMPKGLDWEVIQCDAGNWNGYSEYNIYYIYNSFPEEVMEEVKHNIDDSFHIKPRKITVLYLFPRYPEIFMKDKNWKLIRRGNFLEQCYGMHIFVRH